MNYQKIHRRAALIKDAVIVASKEAAIKINTTASSRKATRKKGSGLREAVSTIAGGEIIHALSQQIHFIRRLASFLECELVLRQFISQLVHDFGVGLDVAGDILDLLTTANPGDNVGSGVGFCVTQEDDGEEQEEESVHEKRENGISIIFGR